MAKKKREMSDRDKEAIRQLKQSGDPWHGSPEIARDLGYATQQVAGVIAWLARR